MCDETGEILEFQTITDSEEIFSHLIQRNIIHFAQASESPLLKESLDNLFLLSNLMTFPGPCLMGLWISHI